jgi:DNA-cytosine methyltransferase
VIDLFCGCGGMSKGLTDAGLNVIAGIDIWDKAINSYSKNFEHNAICADLTGLSPEKFDELYNKDKVPIDIVVGGPPCFIEGTKVLTNNGYKNIETIQLDDKLLTHTSTFHTIINAQKKIYNGDLYDLKIKYHPEIITCTEEHPFYIRKKIKSWDNHIRRYTYHFETPVWVPAKNLTSDDYLGMVINTNDIIPEFSVDRIINQHTTEKVSILLDKPEQWFMMGYFVGDGWIEYTAKSDGRCKNHIRFAINNRDEPIVFEQIHKTLPIIDQHCDTGTCKKFGCSNHLWHQIFSKFGRYAHGKLIPEWVQDAPKHLIQEFINGYMKADGNVRPDGKHRITTVSYDLAMGLQRLYLKLGHIASVSKTIRPSQTMIEGRLVNQRNTFTIEAQINRNRNVSSFIEDNYVWFKPFSISKKSVNNVTVYNFEVDQDNSYIVANTIVHNCQGFSIAGKRDKKDPRNSLFMEYVKYLNYYNPKAFILENVIGILSMKTLSGEKVIDIILSHLSVNYNCVVCKLYASDFEVPQNRRRTIIIGIRKDLQITPHEPTPILSKNNRIPVKTILLPKNEVDQSYYLSERALQGIKNKKEKAKENNNGFGAQFLDMDKPSYTIPARYWKDGYDALVKYSETEVRRLTTLELKRIQSFPDDFIIEGSKKDIIMQIGNAVACRFAYHLGKYIISILQ